MGAPAVASRAPRGRFLSEGGGPQGTAGRFAVVASGAVRVKYRVYIDEVGNPDLRSSDNPNHRFLSLTGVVVELAYVASVLHPEMEQLKTRYFDSHPDNPVILHRKELVNARDPFHALKDARVRAEFDGELLRHLGDWDYTVITVCLDKRKHKETYATWRYDPYHYCMAVLLERYVFLLNRRGARGDCMAESRGGKEDRRLKASYTRLWEQGTDFVEPGQFQQALTSRQLIVKPKANNISGLQLADLVAHPSRNEVLHEQGLLHWRMGRFAELVIPILAGKYDRMADKVFGKKFI